MIYHLSGMSERVAITTREHVNQQNGYVCVSIPIFLPLLFFSLHFPFIFQVPIAEFIVSEFLPFPHSTQKQKLHRQGIRKAKLIHIYIFLFIIWRVPNWREAGIKFVHYHWESDGLHDLQSPGQNKNAQPLVKMWLRISRQL